MPSINFDNSKEVEWNDLKVFIAGVFVTKIQGVKYKSSQEKELLYAAGNKPMGTQKGNRDYTGELKLLKGAVDAMNDAAISAGGDDLLDVEFDIVAAYNPAGTRALRTDTLVAVNLKEYEKGMEQNAKSMPIVLPFIYENQINA